MVQVLCKHRLALWQCKDPECMADPILKPVTWQFLGAPVAEYNPVTAYSKHPKFNPTCDVCVSTQRNPVAEEEGEVPEWDNYETEIFYISRLEGCCGFFQLQFQKRASEDYQTTKPFWHHGVGANDNFRDLIDPVKDLSTAQSRAVDLLLERRRTDRATADRDVKALEAWKRRNAQ